MAILVFREAQLKSSGRTFAYQPGFASRAR